MIVEIEEFLDERGRSPFGEWFDDLSAAAAAKVTVAVDRIGRGLPGDVKAVGGGVFERRIDFGPGYRIYFGTTRKGGGLRIVVLLAGGSKKGQSKDIATANFRWRDFKARQRKGEQ